MTANRLHWAFILFFQMSVFFGDVVVAVSIMFSFVPLTSSDLI